jgi:hypothetical protein
VAVTTVRRWRPADGELEDAVALALQAAAGDTQPLALTDEALASLCAAVESSIPETMKPSGLSGTPIFDVPGWARWHGAIGRYLAARAFANWVGYYGSGLETWFRSILAAYAILRASAAERVRTVGGTMDATMLVQAFADADRLVLHLASAPALAAALDEWGNDERLATG